MTTSDHVYGDHVHVHDHVHDDDSTRRGDRSRSGWKMVENAGRTTMIRAA
jgi:hypothetical protein